MPFPVPYIPIDPLGAWGKAVMGKQTEKKKKKKKT